MARFPIVSVSLFVAAWTALFVPAAHSASTAPLELSSADRLLVLAPHPDDETIGAGGLIQEALRRGCAVHVAWLTNGDFNEWSFLRFSHRPTLTPSQVLSMGRRREDEARLAAERLGLSPEQMTFLGYPDHGTLAIWRGHWDPNSPYRALLTRATAVPYAAALRPGAPYTGRDILRDLETIIRSFNPTVVALSHPADHHPDHRALYLFTRIALWDLGSKSPVRLAPYLVHYPGWPPARGMSALNTELSPPASLQDIAWESLPLTEDELTTKTAALEEHRTQMASGRAFLRRFLRSNELFGDFDVVRLPPPEAERELPVAAPGPPELPTEDITQPAPSHHAPTIRTLSVGQEDSELAFQVVLNRPLRQSEELQIELAGWRPGAPPCTPVQLSYRIGPLDARLRAMNSSGGRPSLSLRRQGKRLSLRVQLADLGHPSRLLLTVQTRSDRLVTHLLPTRVINLTGTDSVK